MNCLLKASNFPRIRFPFFNIRKISLPEGVYSHYNDLCIINKEINKILSTEPINFKSMDVFLHELSVLSHPISRNTAYAAFNKIKEAIKQKKSDLTSNYYLYILHFMVNMEYKFDPTALLKEMNHNGLGVDKNILHQLLVRYSEMGDLESAKLLHASILNRYGPNTFHYVFVICAAIRAKKFKVVEEYRNALSTIEPRLPRFMLGKIMDAYASVFDVDKCIEVYREIQFNTTKMDNPYKEIYRMYYILASSGASNDDLLKAIQFLNNVPNFIRMSITINNLIKANLYEQTILFIEELRMSTSPHNFKHWLRIMILYNDPPADIFHYFLARAGANIDRIFIGEDLLFEDALRTMDRYFFSNIPYANAKLVSHLIYNASKSENSVFKLKTALLYCRFKFSKPNFASFLIVYWLSYIKKCFNMSYSAIITSLTDELSPIEKRYFVSCCIINALCCNEMSEFDWLCQEYPFSVNNMLIFNAVFLSTHVATKVHNENIQKAILLFDKIIPPNLIKMFFDKFIIISCKRNTSAKIKSLVEFLLDNTDYELTNDSMTDFFSKEVPEASFWVLKEIFDKKYSGFLNSK